MVTTQNPSTTPELDQVTHALVFVIETGCPDLTQAARAVMRQSYPGLSDQAWARLTREQRRTFKALLAAS